MKQQQRLNGSNWNHLRFWKTAWPSVLRRVTRSEHYVPPRPLWFKALELTPPEKVKVVIIGDSPYAEEGVANGLAFSTRANCKSIPLATKVILRDVELSFALRPSRTGDLSDWARRGCLLLNASLTTVRGVSNAHQEVGWGLLCFEVLRYLSDRGDKIAFVFCGNQAAEYQAAVDKGKHLVVVTDHPAAPSLGAADGWASQRVFGKLAAFNPELNADFWRL